MYMVQRECEVHVVYYFYACKFEFFFCRHFELLIGDLVSGQYQSEKPSKV